MPSVEIDNDLLGSVLPWMGLRLRVALGGIKAPCCLGWD